MQLESRNTGHTNAPGGQPDAELAQLLTRLSRATNRREAEDLVVRWAAEALGADACALLRKQAVLASCGFEGRPVPVAQLADAAARDLDHISLPGTGALDVSTASVPGAEPAWLVVVRPHVAGFSSAEGDLLAGAARALGLGLRAAWAIEQERGLRRREQREVRQRRRVERELAHQAFHDRLTALPNRHLMRERTLHALERRRHTERTVAMLVIDLDHFKLANDSLDHRRGDRLLLLIAHRLAAAFCSSEQGVHGCTLGRHDGDEFIVLCEDLASEHDAVAIAERIRNALRAPFQVEDQSISMTASIGIAFATREASGEPEEGADALLRDADVALTRAKELGRDRYEIFDVRMRRRLLDRVRLEADLRAALARDELRLFYQPVIAVADGRLIAVEALIRWEHPERGTLVPAQFIPVAEESELIVSLGRWVIDRACQQIADWRASDGVGADLRVSVNVSARQLAPALVQTVAAALEGTGVAPDRLALEITESVLIEHNDLARDLLSELRALGVRIVLDDFGTGYSSLSYLNQFPLDQLKLDRSFTADLTRDPRGAKIVAATIEMARALGMTVVAEGVETSEQLEVLRRLGCDYAQGHLFAAPQTAGWVSRRLRDGDSVGTVATAGGRWAGRFSPDAADGVLGERDDGWARGRHRDELGRVAGWLFLLGTLLSVPADLLIGPSGTGTIVLLSLLGVASAALCFAVPWGRLSSGWLQVMPALGTIEVTLWAAVVGRHGSVATAFYLLIGTVVAYAFSNRRFVAAQVALIAAAMLLPAVLPAGRGFDGVSRTGVTILLLSATVAVVVYLREQMEAKAAELRELAARDPLTGVGNYRLLHERLEYELVRHTREGESLAVLLIDLDRFKQVNERLGHAAGDEVLRRVARALQEALRQQDTVARQGGDEFAVLAPGTDEDGAALLSARVRERLDRAQLAGGSVGATIGWAVCPRDGVTPRTLLARADEALLAGKLAPHADLALAPRTDARATRGSTSPESALPPSALRPSPELDRPGLPRPPQPGPPALPLSPDPAPPAPAAQPRFV